MLDCPVITILVMRFNKIEKQEYNGQLFVAVNGQVTFLGNMNKDKMNEFSIYGIVDVINFDIKGSGDQAIKTHWKSYAIGTLSIMIVIMIMFLILMIQVFKQIKMIKQKIRLMPQFDTDHVVQKVSDSNQLGSGTGSCNDDKPF